MAFEIARRQPLASKLGPRPCGASSGRCATGVSGLSARRLLLAGSAAAVLLFAPIALGPGLCRPDAAANPSAAESRTARPFNLEAAWREIGRQPTKTVPAPRGIPLEPELTSVNDETGAGLAPASAPLPAAPATIARPKQGSPIVAVAVEAALGVPAVPAYDPARRRTAPTPVGLASATPPPLALAVRLNDTSSDAPNSNPVARIPDESRPSSDHVVAHASLDRAASPEMQPSRAHPPASARAVRRLAVTQNQRQNGQSIVAARQRAAARRTVADEDTPVDDARSDSSFAGLHSRTP